MVLVNAVAVAAADVRAVRVHSSAPAATATDCAREICTVPRWRTIEDPQLVRFPFRKRIVYIYNHSSTVLERMRARLLIHTNLLSVSEKNREWEREIEWVMTWDWLARARKQIRRYHHEDIGGGAHRAKNDTTITFARVYAYATGNPAARRPRRRPRPRCVVVVVAVVVYARRTLQTTKTRVTLGPGWIAGGRTRARAPERITDT